MPAPKKQPGAVAAKAFTLVELLIVIAILAVLASLLMTQIVSLRQNSKNTECVMRLRNIGTGLLQYAADHDGYLVPGAIPEYPYRSWFNVLDPYMGGRDTNFAAGPRPAWTQCPSRKFPIQTEFTVGYGWNFSQFGFGFWEEEWASGYNSRLGSVAQPSKTIIVGDSTDLTDNELRYRLIYPGNDPTVVAHRHSGRGNYVFLDGHVGAYSPEELEKNQDLFKKVKPVYE